MPQVARLMREAWPEWYGPQGPGCAMTDLAARSRARGLPFGLVALKDGAPLGTVALDVTSHGAAPGEDCWLIGLVTDPAHRGRGVASALVQAAVAAAEGRVVHAATISAVGLMARQGWCRLRQLPDGYVILRSPA